MTGACTARSRLRRVCGPSKSSCSFAPPADAATGDAGRGAAARIVRGLLRVAPADRDDAAAAAAKLEVLLFVLPLLPPGAGAGRVSDASVTSVRAGAAADDGAIAGVLSQLTVTAGEASAARAPPSVRELLRADFLASPRAAPDAVAAAVRWLTE